MSMPLSYKDLREELNQLLWHFNIPRNLYYQLINLREFLVKNVTICNIEDNKKLLRAIEIVEKIMPRIRNEVS